MIRRIIYWVKNKKQISILKSLYYSYKFKGRVICGKCRINLHGGGKIYLTKGSSLYIGVDYTYPVPTVLDIYQGVLSVNGSVSINRGCKVLIGNNATLEIGDRSFINEGSKIYCREGIKLGSNCAIGFDVKIMDTDIHKIYNKEGQINPNRSILVGDNVWIGANSLILKGTMVENNTIIGANATVKCKCTSNHIYVGAPAKELSEFDYWKL